MWQSYNGVNCAYKWRLNKECLIFRGIIQDLESRHHTGIGTDNFVSISFIFIISLSKRFYNLISRNVWQTMHFFNYKANHLNLRKRTKFWKLAQNSHKFSISPISPATLLGSQILTIDRVTPPIPILKYLHPALQISQFQMILSTRMHHYILVGMYNRTTKKKKRQKKR
ncbi:hypothetical protein GIB67_042207 [Kingdonia uniflora]|uniref:Uncharacterized protein n=1 Tax=Kingdonia uniflora TaxID=39325 RepID=A0A7J7LE48_9MAGN|nr:hypothetical protein GIB67_042207 [Kingdonia uniflora]